MTLTAFDFELLKNQKNNRPILHRGCGGGELEHTQTTRAFRCKSCNATFWDWWFMPDQGSEYLQWMNEHFYKEEREKVYKMCFNEQSGYSFLREATPEETSRYYGDSSDSPIKFDHGRGDL